VIDLRALRRFEEHLEPWRVGGIGPSGGIGPADAGVRVLGYGEISTVFSIGDEGTAFKRMPLFSTVEQARGYAESYRRYTELLREAGLDLPEDETAVIDVPGRPVVLYIAQRQLPPDRFCHVLIHRLEPPACRSIFEAVAKRLSRVWSFNDRRRPGLELAIDGQLSNWVLMEDGRLFFVDTSTPIFRENGVEQLDPELFLASAPGFLRWLLRLAFLDEVMSRYYSPHRVFMDMAANLYKEGREELVAVALPAVNRHLPPSAQITPEEVRKYYSGDKVIWSVFLAFRRLDRWVKTRILGRRYEFVLPGKIRR
jgi:hypothetical protein